MLLMDTLTALWAAVGAARYGALRIALSVEDTSHGPNSKRCAGARHVYACEWNPAAVQALKHNVARNGVAAHCTVLEGDCTAVAPQVCLLASRSYKVGIIFYRQY